MKLSSYVFVFFICVLFLFPFVAFSSEIPLIGVRGGLGTDINLGLAFGIGGNYLLDLGENPLELGAVLYYSHSSETSNNGYNDYHETTDITVFGMMANYLMGYEFGKPGRFVIAGFGIGVVNLYWEEWSPTDESLGELLIDGRTGAASLVGPVLLTGDKLARAAAGYDNNGQIMVSLSFKQEGAGTFEDITTNNIGQQLAIVLDEEIKSAPFINVPISGGDAVIEGINSLDDNKYYCPIFMAPAKIFAGRNKIYHQYQHSNIWVKYTRYYPKMTHKCSPAAVSFA